MELNHLKVFYEVSKAGKFADIAKKLHISQSALSRSVSLLETNYGVQLLDRSRKGVTLTPKGIEVYRLCEELFQLEKQIENVCLDSNRECSGVLSFSASDHIVNYLLPNEVHPFRIKYPKIIPCIRTGSPEDIVNQLLTTESEFGLLFAKVNNPQIEYKKIREQKMSLVCHPKLWQECLMSTTEKTIKKIIKKKGYISSIGAISDRRLTRVIEEVFGEIPNFGLEVDSQESQKKFCLAGEGIAYLTRFMVEAEIEQGKLFEIPSDSLHDFNLWLARPRGKHLSLNSRTFIKHIARELVF